MPKLWYQIADRQIRELHGTNFSWRHFWEKSIDDSQIPWSVFHDLFKGIKYPTLPQAILIAQALGCTLDDLFGPNAGEDPQPQPAKASKPVAIEDLAMTLVIMMAEKLGPITALAILKDEYHYLKSKENPPCSTTSTASTSSSSLAPSPSTSSPSGVFTPPIG